MFYSGNFSYDNKASDFYEIHLVSEGGGVLNDYSVNFDESEEITLTFCYADEFGEAYVWTDEAIENVHEWFITDDFKPFISEDNEDIIYLLRGKSIKKRFTANFKGLIDVTFEIYKNYAYKKTVKKVKDVTKAFKLSNLSNLSTPYKPIIELFNVQSDTVTISNLTTGEEPLSIEDISLGRNIIIDCEIGTIVDSEGNNLLRNSNRKWLKLKRGTNNIKIEGTCTAEIRAMYPVMR